MEPSFKKFPSDRLFMGGVRAHQHASAPDGWKPFWVNADGLLLDWDSLDPWSFLI